MNKYWVLAWDQHYPCSALGNVHSTHPTPEEAIEAAKKIPGSDIDYVRAVDITPLLEKRRSGDSYIEIWRPKSTDKDRYGL